MNILTLLRQETKAQHEALHVHPLLRPLTSPSITFSQYYDSLRAFELYYRHIENRMDNSIFAGMPNAPVREWLQQDFYYHRLAPLAQDITLKTPLLLDTPGRQLGYLYTKQGSTLGGQVMSKHLAKHLELIPHEHQHFFAGYGAHTGKQWKIFIENLCRESKNRPANEIVEGAVAAFEAMSAACDTIMELRKNAAKAA